MKMGHTTLTIFFFEHRLLLLLMKHDVSSGSVNIVMAQYDIRQFSTTFNTKMSMLKPNCFLLIYKQKLSITLSTAKLGLKCSLLSVMAYPRVNSMYHELYLEYCFESLIKTRNSCQLLFARCQWSSEMSTEVISKYDEAFNFLLAVKRIV